MQVIKILVSLLIIVSFSCKHIKNNFEEKHDTLIDGKYTLDSILLDGYDPFIDNVCAMEISDMIKGEIIRLVQREYYQSVLRKKTIWFSIEMRANGEILDFDLKTKVLPKKKEEELKNIIIEKNIF